MGGVKFSMMRTACAVSISRLWRIASILWRREERLSAAFALVVVRCMISTAYFDGF